VKVNHADGMFQRGIGTSRSRAAGAGRRIVAGRERTTVPGIKRAPSRSGLAHVQHDNPVGVRQIDAGRPTVRKVQLPSGRRMTQEAKADSRNGDRKPGTAWPAPPPDGFRITGRIRAVARPERELTWVR
jgi:hypothetical protein